MTYEARAIDECFQPPTPREMQTTRSAALIVATEDPWLLPESTVLALDIGAVYDDHELQNPAEVMNNAVEAIPQHA